VDGVGPSVVGVLSPGPYVLNSNPQPVGAVLIRGEEGSFGAGCKVV
jgi:hypothetical protein